MGFSHPEDLFRDDLLPNTFRRLWYFVASICFRSTEAYAHDIGEPSAMGALQKEPLLSITPNQRGMFGKERTEECMRALGVQYGSAKRCCRAIRNKVIQCQ